MQLNGLNVAAITRNLFFQEKLRHRTLVLPLIAPRRASNRVYLYGRIVRSCMERKSARSPCPDNACGRTRAFSASIPAHRLRSVLPATRRNRNIFSKCLKRSPDGAGPASSGKYECPPIKDPELLTLSLRAQSRKARSPAKAYGLRGCHFLKRRNRVIFPLERTIPATTPFDGQQRMIDWSHVWQSRGSQEKSILCWGLRALSCCFSKSMPFRLIRPLVTRPDNALPSCGPAARMFPLSRARTVHQTLCRTRRAICSNSPDGNPCWSSCPETGQSNWAHARAINRLFVKLASQGTV